MTNGRASTAGLLLIVSGPSGAGKTTIARRAESSLDAVFSVSMTTRSPSDKDREGRDYYFVDESTFHAHRAQGDMLEWARVFDHCYGTPRRPVEEAMANGRVVILEIDVKGAVQVMEKMPEALALFIEPPGEADLLQRLRQRGRDAESVIQRRFQEARREIREARDSGIYEAFIVNDDLDQAVAEVLQRVGDRRAARRSGAVGS